MFTFPWNGVQVSSKHGLIDGIKLHPASNFIAEVPSHICCFGFNSQKAAIMCQERRVLPGTKYHSIIVVCALTVISNPWGRLEYKFEWIRMTKKWLYCSFCVPQMISTSPVMSWLHHLTFETNNKTTMDDNYNLFTGHRQILRGYSCLLSSTSLQRKTTQQKFGAYIPLAPFMPLRRGTKSEEKLV